ncbi:MAG: toxin-antitoxin system YwqK family antitoxin [Deltaproteobacteria bacterium]|nr:toxin-antitoxin system YwqK family antitoxin [Deltaproteobacteria bacterium]
MKENLFSISLALIALLQTQALAAGIDELKCPDGSTLEAGQNGDGEPMVQCMKGDVPDGGYIVYYEPGKPKEQSTKHNGVRSGAYTKWYENGVVYMKGAFKNGKQDGKWTVYWESGKKKSEGLVRNGQQNGTWKIWDENGHEIVETAEARNKAAAEERQKAIEAQSQKKVKAAQAAADRNAKAVSDTYCKCKVLKDWYEAQQSKEDRISAQSGIVNKSQRYRNAEAIVTIEDFLTSIEPQLGRSPAAIECSQKYSLYLRADCNSAIGEWRFKHATGE